MPCCPSAAFARDVISFGTALHGCALGRAWRHAGQMMQMLREETLRKRWGKGFGDHRKNGLFNHQKRGVNQQRMESRIKHVDLAQLRDKRMLKQRLSFGFHQQT
jgi:hypothetical protein